MSKRPNDPGYAAGWCIHYRASHGGETFTDCEAGVPFEKWNGTKFATRPCFLDEKGQSKPDAMPCEHLRRPTPDEIADHEVWLAGRMSRIGVVMKAICPWRDAHKNQNFREIVGCPICEGRLHLSIAAYNGHVHGRCETADCVSWME